VVFAILIKNSIFGEFKKIKKTGISFQYICSNVMGSYHQKQERKKEKTTKLASSSPPFLLVPMKKQCPM
jgi:hypothetical protein